MAVRSARHATFTIARQYGTPPSRVFAAWADEKSKARWFHGPGRWTTTRRELDFRAGGSERVIGRRDDEQTSDFEAHYLDIVTDARIVYSYTMRRDGTMISASLATVEFAVNGKNTDLTFTEQAVFFDTYDDPQGRVRQHRMGALLDNLERALHETARG